jgi:hypothetical protein
VDSNTKVSTSIRRDVKEVTFASTVFLPSGLSLKSNKSRDIDFIPLPRAAQKGSSGNNRCQEISQKSNFWQEIFELNVKIDKSKKLTQEMIIMRVGRKSELNKGN